ncbi:MAG: ParB N-terminal domain-containing protein [Simplicispira sp.]|nr:ParB N-terminal domain-containing protein [Simplicispira sp.]
MTNFHKPEQSGQAAALPKTYAQHPLSAAFPAMTPEEFQELKDSINNIGVQNPITLLDGMVIDGWHRYNACMVLGMDFPVVELEPGIDPRDFVMAQNQARRHVTKAQLAMATTAVYAWRPHGDQRTATMDTECPSPKTTVELAEIAGVHVTTIKQAKTVTAQAAPAVVDAVKRGELGLPKAAAIAKLPPEQQAQAISKPLPRPVSVVPPPKTAPAVTLATIDEDEDGAPSEEEIAAAFAAEEDDRKLMHQMLESDDALATLHAEVTRLNAALRITNERFNGLMNTNAALTDLIKKRDWQIKKLHKEIDELRKQGGAQ